MKIKARELGKTQKCINETFINEILALHDKWLGYEISDFEFFTLLSEIRFKYKGE